MRVRIPPRSWKSVSFECCVLSGRGFCVGLITCPEESYRGLRVWVWISKPQQWIGLGPLRGCRAIKKFTRKDCFVVEGMKSPAFSVLSYHFNRRDYYDGTIELCHLRRHCAFKWRNKTWRPVCSSSAKDAVNVKTGSLIFHHTRPRYRSCP